MPNPTIRVPTTVTKDDILWLLGAKGMELCRLTGSDKPSPDRIFAITQEIAKWATVLRVALAREPDTRPPVNLEALNKYRGLGSGDDDKVAQFGQD